MGLSQTIWDYSPALVCAGSALGVNERLRLNVDTLKIDRSFVSTVETVPESAAIVRALVDLARNLSIEVVAEGVENDAQREFLTEIGCGYGQGFLFSRPLNAAETAELLRTPATASKGTQHCRHGYSSFISFASGSSPGL